MSEYYPCYRIIGTTPQPQSKITTTTPDIDETKFLNNRYMRLARLIQRYNYLIETFQYNSQTAKPLVNNALSNTMVLSFKTPFEAKIFEKLIEDEHTTTVAYQELHPQDIIWQIIEPYRKIAQFLESPLAYILSIFVIVGLNQYH